MTYFSQRNHLYSVIPLWEDVLCFDWGNQWRQYEACGLAGCGGDVGKNERGRVCVCVCEHDRFSHSMKKLTQIDAMDIEHWLDGQRNTKCWFSSKNVADISAVVNVYPILFSGDLTYFYNKQSLVCEHNSQTRLCTIASLRLMLISQTLGVWESCSAASSPWP